MATHYENEHPEPRGERDGPYEHPALEMEPGYWAERWAEFKRLFSLSWNDGYKKETFILSSTVFVGMTLWGVGMRVWELLFG